MSITQTRCPNCTAPLTIDVRQGRHIVCQYCGTAFTIDTQTWKSMLEAEKDVSVLETEEKRAEQNRKNYAALAAEEEKHWKNWILQWRILLAAVAVLSFLNFAIPGSSSFSRAVNMVWGLVFLGSTIYLAVRRPELTAFRPKSTFAKGSKIGCYLKLTGIKWLVALIAVMAADLF